MAEKIAIPYRKLLKASSTNSDQLVTEVMEQILRYCIQQKILLDEVL